MQITIEDSSMIYIYMKSPENHKKVGKCISDVRCNLLYDEKDNLIGIKLFNEYINADNGQKEQIKLPEVGYIDMPLHNANISETETDITIMFNGSSVIHHIKEDECNIDLCNEGIFGIEPIPFTYIGEKEVIKLFIIEDIPLRLTKL
jgi:hypothetical protein